MNQEQIVSLLQENVCELDFTKLNGERKVTKGTLSTNYISRDEQQKSIYDDQISYWDISSSQWKSFIYNNLNSITPILSE
jgi:hypothetical protein